MAVVIRVEPRAEEAVAAVSLPADRVEQTVAARAVRTATMETRVLPAILTATRWSRESTWNETGKDGLQAPTSE